MNVEIRTLPERKVVGVKIRMSHAANKTNELWRALMPHRKEIQCPISSELLSITRYDSIPDFRNFNPATEFEKWAGVEVSSFGTPPLGMSTLVIPAGLYAVFHYKGLSTDSAPYQHIFGRWLPDSEFKLDHREHYEMLGPLYRNNDPDSEEDICIPIVEK
jgi:AraC family transcriptional regulator